MTGHETGRQGLGVAARLSLFAAGLAVVFVAAFGVGRAVGPDGDSPAPPSAPTTVTTEMPAGHDMDMGS